MFSRGINTVQNIRKIRYPRDQIRSLYFLLLKRKYPIMDKRTTEPQKKVSPWPVYGTVSTKLPFRISLIPAWNPMIHPPEASTPFPCNKLRMTGKKKNMVVRTPAIMVIQYWIKSLNCCLTVCRKWKSFCFNTSYVKKKNENRQIM